MHRVKVPPLGAAIGLAMIAGALFFAACGALKLGQSTDDKAITTQVQAKLFDDPVLKTRDIHVTSDKGTVTLSGTVGTDLEKAAVERIAGQADGVKNVVDQLVVSSASLAAAPATTQPAETSEAAPPLSPAPSAPSERHRASGRRRRAESSYRGETSAEEAVQQAPVTNPPVTTAQAALPAAAAPPPPAVAPPAPVVKPPEEITIPSGTVLSVRMIDSIDSTRGNAGDQFAATLEAPVVVGDRVVIPRNANARVRLVQATSAGRVSGRSDLKVELVSVTAGGQTYPLETGYYEQTGASRGKRTAETAGGGAVLGALIGALAGRGKGAAIGTVAGAGAGTAAGAATHGQPLRIPSETKLDFTLKSPVTISLNSAT